MPKPLVPKRVAGGAPWQTPWRGDAGDGCGGFPAQGGGRVSVDLSHEEPEDEPAQTRSPTAWPGGGAAWSDWVNQSGGDEGVA